MRTEARSSVICVAAMILCVTAGRAQDRPAPAHVDARVGLRPGVRDAGAAAWHMTLVASLPKPDGFTGPDLAAVLPAAEPAAPTAATGESAPVAPRRPPIDLSFANTDLAFGGDHLFSGN